jgi:uncharacterized membrane protein
MNSQVHYLPMTPGLFSILAILLAGLILLIQLRILRYAYMRLGIGSGVALLLLGGSLIGSYFNIPVAVLPGTPVRSGEIVVSSACAMSCRWSCNGPARCSRSMSAVP